MIISKVVYFSLKGFKFKVVTKREIGFARRRRREMKREVV
jgi:hypothetical protein